MKKIILSAVMITLVFALHPDARDGREKLFKMPAPSPEEKKLDRNTWEAKKTHFIKLKRRQEARIDWNRPGRVRADNPLGMNIETDDTYIYRRDDSLGGDYMTGICHNAGSAYAANITVTVTFYDAGQNILGDDTGFVYGGSHYVLDGGGGPVCVNALAPPANGTQGEYGFFYICPLVNHSGAEYYSLSFTAEDATDWPYANAKLGFHGNVYYGNTDGDVEFSGDVKNESADYVAYESIVYMAALSSDGSQVLDVAWTYVEGAPYGSSAAAVYPGAHQPFSVFMTVMPNSSASGGYMASFEWLEAPYNPAGETDPPFGALVVPSGGETLQSSWPVIGWALDDTAVARVDIYVWRNGSWLDIGDATFVDGARPDIAALYPGYPNNTRAGWGYMLLSYFLPGGGNGDYTIKATAVDIAGKSADLGIVTITNDNTNAIKPFGAIDSPASGGTASGSSYRNNGWALTAQPNTIPTDGSTINVYIDGAVVGKAQYNIYRSDIASLFPGYNNSGGAAGYFDIDTTAYADGLHTIQWTAQDNAGNVDGIGSRYFTIDNGSGGAGKTAAAPGNFMSKAVASPGKFNRATVNGMPAEAAVFIETKQAERVELQLTRPIAGYMKVGGRLEKLPTGSTLDPAKGTFSWLPLAPFMGGYELVFVETGADGALRKRPVTIRVNLEN